MPEWLVDFLNNAGQWAGWLFVALLCLGGILMSCVTLSGTWLVILATIIAVLMPPAAPGWNLVIVFIVIAVGIELIEWFASAWGVQKRGGSKWAGFAALIGGIVGLFAGTLIPIPVIGNLIGMIVCSFGAAYWVEKHRLKAHDQAMHIAWGTVTARVLVLFLKVGATIAMIAGLVTAITS